MDLKRIVTILQAETTSDFKWQWSEYLAPERDFAESRNLRSKTCIPAGLDGSHVAVRAVV